MTVDLFDVKTRGQAIELAQAIVAGRTSRHWNFAIDNSGGGIERVQAVTACTQADAADVTMLVALSTVLPEMAP
jgi:hypothetical protein